MFSFSRRLHDAEQTESLINTVIEEETDQENTADEIQT